ncbi:PLDc N-terminal domain-containing protein [Microbacterium oleivorans]|uniref:PLDc N-terminal domain-containing protein n=1 Tax=Microbacterium oleivorans TaxID=273677 RepID=UPI0033FCC159
MIVNPLLPSVYDVVWSLVAVIVVALAVVALVSLARAGRGFTSVQALAWVLVVLFVPVLGPVAWLAVGRHAAVAGRSASRT